MSFFNNLSTLFDSATKIKGKRPHQTKKTSDQKTQSQPKKQPTAPPQGRSKSTYQAPEDASLSETKAKAREIIVEAKDEALTIKTKAEGEARQLNEKLEQQQQSLDDKLSRIEKRLGTIENKENKLDQQRQELEKLKIQLEDKQQNILDKLEQIASLTKDEAKAQLFAELEKKLSQEMAQFIRQKEEEAHQEADERVKEIVIDVMLHGATDYVAEYTISTIELPSEDVKGKIIGKSGRNIHAFEKITGVDVDLDSDPKTVRLSSFNPVRREIARISLQRLIKDGRIQPTRIEDTVKKVKKEIDKITFEAGKKLCHEVGVFNLPRDLMQLLGKFKYRFSYGQNLIAHTLEETQIGTKLAHEMGLDADVVKLGCLLHDIGKVSEDVDGSHVELGVKIAKKFDLPQDVIDCVAQHHEDEPFSGPEQMAVYIADAISGARPGARYENYEEYVERLEKIEEIASQYEEVGEAYAIQAGREVRVILEPKKSKDDDVTVLATKIKDEIKDNVTYPGTVTVTVIREQRSQAIAK